MTTTTASADPRPVVVIGAGLAGLSAARVLVDAGRTVVVADKGRSPGGRLATRRIDGARLDHGAQFFTVRSDEFAEATATAVDAGVVTEWCRGFGDGDGYPRYAGATGLNALARHLAEGLDVRTTVLVTAIEPADDGWRVTFDDGSLDAASLVVTSPMPQTLALLDAGPVVLAPDVRRRLDAVEYHPTLALLVVLDGPSAVPGPGGVQLDEGEFSFVADNQQKGISDRPALTLHVDHHRSAERWDEPDGALLDDLVRRAAPWVGDANVVEAQLKRWRYAQPVAPFEDEFLADTPSGAAIAFAGDAFAGAKVEGAWRSGRAAAHWLVGQG